MTVVDIRRLGPDDIDLLCSAREGVFDRPVDPVQAAAFLTDDRHEIVAAVQNGAMVGMATAVVILHPDQPSQLFVIEVGVLPDVQRQGIAKQIMQQMLAIAQTRGCSVTWLATEADNLPARGLYRTLNGQETEDVVMFEWENDA